MLTLTKSFFHRWGFYRYFVLLASLAITVAGCSNQSPILESVNADITEPSPRSTAADPTVVALFQTEGTSVAAPGSTAAISDAVTPEPTVAPVFDPNVEAAADVEDSTAADDVELEGLPSTAISASDTLSDVSANIDSILASSAISDTADVEPLRPSADALYGEQLLYDDALNDNWTLENSFLIEYDALNTRHWFETLEELNTSSLDTESKTSLTTGAVSIEVQPEEDYGALFFAVQPEAETTYSLDDVLGVSFWLNSGPQLLDTADLAVTVVGSNDLPYWQPGDDSVFGELVDNPSAQTFSETRLYFLDINRSIPPNTWTRVFVWLDELEFQPDFEFVTGFYIKNDENFRGTFYVDRVSLLTLPSETAQ